jgi:hypothetical protein
MRAADCREDRADPVRNKLTFRSDLAADRKALVGIKAKLLPVICRPPPILARVVAEAASEGPGAVSCLAASNRLDRPVRPRRRLPGGGLDIYRRPRLA